MCVIKSVLYSFLARITRITRIFFREMIIALLILALQIRVIRVIRALSISKEAYDTPSKGGLLLSSQALEEGDDFLKSLEFIAAILDGGAHEALFGTGVDEVVAIEQCLLVAENDVVVGWGR